MQLVSFSLHKNYARGTQRYPRLLFSTPIRVHHLMTGGIRSSRGVSLDISEGGLGALVESKLEVGDTVGIELNLPEYDLNAVGIVRYTSSVRSGFEFLGLTAEEWQHIANLVGSA